ncbi:VOC family protein [Solimonas marina]|uniref:VOC family protein n=1 Tax=Solimonas marina TaxID=2714601 RepID=UPI0019D11248|nr:VOC family protein [Solimonas marina]
MSTLSPYLFFDGDCAPAMQFYERTLGGRMIMMMRHGDAPPDPQHPVQDPERVMHAQLELEGQTLMASDWMAGQAFPGRSGMNLSLVYPSAERARAIFDALAVGGDVRMPFGPTFWAAGFGMLTDRYGTPWMVGGGEPAGGANCDSA